MNKERKKKIVLIILSFTLIGIGCLNFNKNQIIEVSSENTDIKNELSLGDVQLVNSEPIEKEEKTYTEGIVPNDDIVENKSIIENNSQYFIETRLERDTMYSETVEIYQKMIDSTEISADQKAIAAQEISSITNTKNAIMIAENLIKNKGFEDVVILVNNGIVSVVVKSSLLTQEQVAKIQNIVSRELQIDVKNINISNK